MHHHAAELSSNNTDVAVITETHFKSKHSGSIVSLPDYTVCRRDRTVAVYARSALQPTVWQNTTADCRQLPYELLWVRIGCTIHHDHLTQTSH